MRRRIVPTPIPRWPNAPIELTRDHPLHDLPNVLADQPDGVIDDATLFAVVAAPLCLRLLIRDEALQPLTDELHDGVDDALLLEVTVATSTMPIVAIAATMPVAAAVMATTAIVTTVVIVATVTVVMVTPIMAIVVASIVSIAVAIAPTVLASALVTAGARPDEPFERLQSFEDLTPVVVSHGNPPSCRLPWPARAMQAFSPMRRHQRNARS